MFSFSVNSQTTTKSSVTQVQHTHTVSVQSAHPYWVYWSLKTHNTPTQSLYKVHTHTEYTDQLKHTTHDSFYDMKTDTEPVQIWVWYTAVIWNKYDTNNTNLLLFQICITLTKKWCLHPDFFPVFRQSSTHIFCYLQMMVCFSQRMSMYQWCINVPFLSLSLSLPPVRTHTRTHTHT